MSALKTPPAGSSSVAARPETGAHLFTVGQIVRLKRGIAERPGLSGVYRITGTLPPIGASPQYRIRCDDERHERVTTQDNLEAVRAPAGDAAVFQSKGS